MTIADHLRKLADAVNRIEHLSESQDIMLDRIFDLHNDLTEWAVNSDHGDAALEVLAILETYTANRCEVPTLPLPVGAISDNVDNAAKGTT